MLDAVDTGSGEVYATRDDKNVIARSQQTAKCHDEYSIGISEETSD